MPKICEKEMEDEEKQQRTRLVQFQTLQKALEAV